MISSKYTKRKPDLLSLWSSVPEWTKTRSPVEFKIESISNVGGSSLSLPVITEGPGLFTSRGSPPPSCDLQPQDMSPSAAALTRRRKPPSAALELEQYLAHDLFSPRYEGLDLPWVWMVLEDLGNCIKWRRVDVIA